MRWYIYIPGIYGIYIIGMHISYIRIGTREGLRSTRVLVVTRGFSMNMAFKHTWIKLRSRTRTALCVLWTYLVRECCLVLAQRDTNFEDRHYMVLLSLRLDPTCRTQLCTEHGLQFMRQLETFLLLQSCALTTNHTSLMRCLTNTGHTATTSRKHVLWNIVHVRL